MCISWKRFCFIAFFFFQLSCNTAKTYAVAETIRYEGEIYPSFKHEINGTYQGFEIGNYKHLLHEKNRAAFGVSGIKTEFLGDVNNWLVVLDKSVEGIYRGYEHSEDSYKSKEGVYVAVCAVALIIVVLLNIYIRHLRKKILSTDNELRKQHIWLTGTLASIEEAIVTTDEKGTVTFINNEAQKLFDISDTESIGKSLEKLLEKILDENRNPYAIPLEKVINDNSAITFENKRIFIKDEAEKLVTGSIVPIGNSSSEVIGAVIVVKDTTQLKKSEEIIFTMEYFDSLTGLPNRTLFSDRLNMALAHARRNEQQCALIILDLDNFKTINDTLGHAMGDLLLKLVSEKIRSCLREVDTVARLGGDEFIILQPQIGNINDATKIADRILRKFQRPWTLGDKQYYITASLGIAIYPNDGQDEQTLFKNADTAMYKAKEVGRNNYQLFAESMNIKVQQKLEIENSLRMAVERDEFVLFYQPQVDIVTGNIVGVEALLRWYRPGFGLVPPLDFIPLAEETGLIIPIGEWVLRTACRQNKEWIDKGFAPRIMAVNLSARQFQQHDLYDRIEKILKDTGLPPNLLELEITESTAIQNINLSMELLDKLRLKGIRISLDDFGIGFSSLNYLKQLPINTLKIDKSFVRDITEKSKEEAIAKSVIELAHKMKLDVIAEGVETFAQLDFLRQQSCDKYQGFLFSKPVPTNEIEAMIKG